MVRPAVIVKQIGLLRMVGYAFLLAMFLVGARYSHHIPLMVDAERQLYDLTANLTAPFTAPDSKITVVSYDSSTLELTKKRSPKDRGLLAKALTAIDAMHPKAIGVDLIFDQPQPEDAELIRSLRAMKTPTWIAYLDANEKNGACSTGDVGLEQWQSDYLNLFFAQLAGSNAHKTSVMFCDDPDFVLRRWPAPRREGPLMASAMVFGGHAARRFAGPLLFHKARAQADGDAGQADTAHSSEFDSAYTRIPIQSFAGDPGSGLAVTPGSVMYNLLKGQIEGRYVLVGVTVSGEDQFLTPQSGRAGDRMYGIDVHANAIDQILGGRFFRPLPRAVLWGVVVAAMVFGAAASLMRLKYGFVVSALVTVVLLGVAPMLLRRAGIDTLMYPAFGSFVAWAGGYVVVGAAARSLSSTQRSFAQSALGKYLPKDIAREIIRDPDRLALHGERVDIFAVFTDLEGFTRFADSVAPEMLAKVLNQYLDVLSATVLEHGGTIDKFVGDSVIAFWGAPIARPDDAERATRAAEALYLAGERFRSSLPPGVPPIGRTRVGLHKSSVIVGNFGGEGRIQYTAFGDAMNAASRLESANKHLATRGLASAEALEGAGEAADSWRPMGKITVRGRSAPLEVFEPAPDFAEAARSRLADSYRRFVAGETAALEDIAALARELPEDAALMRLVERLRTSGPAGSYSLG